MSEHASGATDGLLVDATGATGAAQSMRIAVLDRDSGFLTVLGKRLERAGWEYRVLASSVAPETIVPMRLAAIVVDLTVIGPTWTEWLERLCGALPELGVIVCTGGSTRRPARARAAPRRRRLADQALPSRGADRAASSRSCAAGGGSRPSSTAEPVLAGEVEIHRDQYQAFVRGVSIDLTRREFELIELLASSGGRVLEREFIYQRLWGYAMVRGDRSVDVFVRKLRQKLERVSPGWRYIHTHFGIGYRFAAEPAWTALEPAPR